jgi:hypothetical protein
VDSVDAFLEISCHDILFFCPRQSSAFGVKSGIGLDFLARAPPNENTATNKNRKEDHCRDA